MSASDRAWQLGPADVVPVAVAERSGMVESIHHGVAVGVDGGELVVAAGDPDAVVYPRSANKPLQADAMLRLGLTVDDRLLAIACASHDGTERHVAVVRELLGAHGLTPDDLQNTPALPLSPGAALAWCRAGGGPDALHQNCSGKHAAMLATCVVSGWPIDAYLDQEHPLQRSITDRIVELAGRVPHVGVDGCGAPAHAVSSRALAVAVGTLARQRSAVWSAMTAWPDLVGGDDREDTRLMRAVPELIAKSGAEGVMVAALPDGRAAAVKIADGNHRATGIVMAQVLRRLGVEVPTDAAVSPILGHGEPVGEVVALPL